MAIRKMTGNMRTEPAGESTLVVSWTPNCSRLRFDSQPSEQDCRAENPRVLTLVSRKQHWTSPAQDQVHQLDAGWKR